MIISVGYRVHSYRGVQFRIWATKVLKEYIVKGFALNDDLLKRAGGGNYFDELLARIRDIRSSEKVFYRKVLEIYALSIDYDPRVEMTQEFFKTVQNKMHYSVHGHTAAEIIYDRADAEKDFMGLTTWTGALPKQTDAEIAKNYLSQEEISTLNRMTGLPSLMISSVYQGRTSSPMPDAYPHSWPRPRLMRNMTSSKNARKTTLHLLRFISSNNLSVSEKNSATEERMTMQVR